MTPAKHRDDGRRLDQFVSVLSRSRDLGPDSPLDFLEPAFRLQSNPKFTRFARNHCDLSAPVVDIRHQLGIK